MTRMIDEYSPHVVAASYEGGCRIWLRFDDGIAGVVDVRDQVPRRGVLRKFWNPDFVAQVSHHGDQWTVEWPGNMDLDPMQLYCAVRGIQPPTYKQIDGVWKRVSPLVQRATTGRQFRPVRRTRAPLPRAGTPRRGPIPEISRFWSFRIRMRARAPGPAQLYVKSDRESAVLGISPPRVLRGRLEPYSARHISTWIRRHKPQLLGNWKRLQSGLPAKWIAPLR